MRKILIIFICIYAVSCTSKESQNTQNINDRIIISPHYTNSVIPCNIAPLNFKIKNSGDKYFAIAYSNKGRKIKAKGSSIRWNIKKWHQLLTTNKGDTLYTKVYIKKDKQWYKYPVIKNYIAPENIDNYLSYRLIEPGYTIYEHLTINQRNLTSFSKKVIYSNSLLSQDEDGQCINCHAYQDYNRSGQMQFHIRQFKGGTVIVTPNEIKKIDLSTKSTISAGVYPSWHPSKNLIAYSVNNISQHFPPKGKEKVEVQDSRSGLTLYDIDKNKVSIIVDEPDQLETFPSWSPDGKYLYFVSAQYPEGIAPDDDLMLKYKEFHYNIYRKRFDSKTLKFSETELVFDASAINKSATFPRISPNGRYLLFTMADYGNFHIWHKSSDLYLFDLEKMQQIPIPEVNSPDAESYHSWSSNGHWIIFSSRRIDGSYTRPYISYFNNGKLHNPFIVPQKNPDFYFSLFKSYNIPEFMAAPVTVTKRQLMKAIDDDAKKVVL